MSSMRHLLFLAVTAAVFLLAPAALAETKYTVISPSIILMGEPAPEPAPEAEPVASAGEDLPDVMAGGELREDGVKPAAPAPVQPVAEGETTAAIDGEPAGEADTSGEVPVAEEQPGQEPTQPLLFEDEELRTGE